ncbi:MAG TPA: ABC transporter ATP-binding protein [Phycisphaerae bacterium]|nr:ABC transporter ATP-binding protein [Phycisphaerae bacterium]
MQPLLKVEGLRVWFPKTTSFLGKPLTYVKAVDDVAFELPHGKTLGLVGESGSGKTTAGLAVLRALHPRSGTIEFSPDGEQVHELSHMTAKQLRPLRRHMQMIFQDPFSSLNPRMTVQQVIAEPLKVSKTGDAKQRKQRVQELLDEVGLSSAFLNRYPHAFSGGQRQRIAVARALALNPLMVVCDEPLSALDVSVQAQIINLMMELKAKHNLSLIFISHDLHVVKHLADDVAVMYAGQLMEVGPRKKIFDNPLHPYAQALLASAPTPDPRARGGTRILAGEVPDPSNLPRGCVFHPRCPRAMENCADIVPHITHKDERDVRCLLYENGPADQKMPPGPPPPLPGAKQ